MTALTDPRPHVFIEVESELDDHLDASALGRLVRQLLDAYPDIELTTIRLWTHDANGVPTLRVDARRGKLAEPECPSCHTVAGHPHTEYCQLVDYASQLTHLELNGPMTRQHYAPPCSAPAADRGDGRGCQTDNCPRHNA